MKPINGIMRGWDMYRFFRNKDNKLLKIVFSKDGIFKEIRPIEDNSHAFIAMSIFNTIEDGGSVGTNPFTTLVDR